MPARAGMHWSASSPGSCISCVLVKRHSPTTTNATAVKAKGAWSGGKWTLELARRLSTGQSDDTPFDPAKTCKMALAVFDQTGNMDKASPVIELSFK